MSPADLADRLKAYLGSRGQSVLRQVVGEVDDAADVLERMAEVLRAWDRAAAEETADDVTRAGTPLPRPTPDGQPAGRPKDGKRKGS